MQKFSDPDFRFSARSKSTIQESKRKMSSDSIDAATLKAMLAQIPSIENLQKTVFQLLPDLISITFEPESRIPIAAVCLRDTVNTLAEARYALCNALTHKVEYAEKTDPQDQVAAIFFTRFYADDAALRLYSAGEHLAQAIVDMLEISQKDLPRGRQKKASRQKSVGKYLRKEKPTHPVAIAALGLANSSEWKKTIRYRNDWVHSQPPPVKGLGIVYKRGQRWKLSDYGNTFELGFGGGDEPEYSLDDLLKFIQPAFAKFTETSDAIVQFYIELLKRPSLSR